jgi:hypothetical protein
MSGSVINKMPFPAEVLLSLILDLKLISCKKIAYLEQENALLKKFRVFLKQNLK